MFLIRALPALLGSITVLLLCLFSNKIASCLVDLSINWGNLYTAVFDWSAIQTGFLFGVYGFVVGSPTAFMTAIQEQPVFKYFQKGVLTSLVAGFILTITSLPLSLFSPNPFVSSGVLKFVCFLWFGVFIFALGSFFRAAYLFAYMTRQPSSDKIDG